jgi:hypothetical protein
MSAVQPGTSTVAYIRKKVRRLTASSSESALTTADIDEAINNFYLNDFAYGIKIDQMRSVYTFYTRPNIDRYPLDVNYNQGVRAPVYVDGIQGTFYKDRVQFFNLYPKFPTRFQPASGDGLTQLFNFTIPGPFLSNTVTLGTVATTGAAISISDDGAGSLYYRLPNPVVSVPAENTNPGTPGMANKNTGNPGLINSILIGTVDYVTGVFAINLALASVTPAAGSQFTLWVSQYQPGKPYCLLFWNNEFTIRPVPKLVHKIEVETYLTPVQFLLSTDLPILNQWAKYLAYGAAIDILFDRQDLEGVANLTPMFDRQEGLVLERQGVEELFVPTYTLFNSTQYNFVNGGFSQGGSF